MIGLEKNKKNLLAGKQNCIKELTLCNKLKFPIPKSIEPDDVHLKYFKLRLKVLAELIV